MKLDVGKEREAIDDIKGNVSTATGQLQLYLTKQTQETPK